MCVIGLIAIVTSGYIDRQTDRNTLWDSGRSRLRVPPTRARALVFGERAGEIRNNAAMPIMGIYSAVNDPSPT